MAGCPLDSKSLGESDDGTEASDADDDDDDGSTDAGDDFPAPAQELRRSSFDDTTPSELAVAPDGTIYAVGRRGYTWDAESFDGRYDSVWIAELDATGAIVWERLEPALSPRGIAVAAAADGLVVSATFADIDTSPTLTRYDGDGEPVWTIQTSDGPARLAMAGDRIAVAGVTTIGADRFDAWTAEFDGVDGTLVWETDAGTGAVRSSVAESVAFAPDGDVIVGGGQGVMELTGRTRAFLARIDPSGATRWEQTYTEGETSDGVIDVRVTSDGTIHAAIVEDDTHWVRRFDGDGTETFATTSSYVDAITSMAVMDDGSFVAIDGGSDDAPGLRIARHDADGDADWYGENEDCELGVDVVLLANDELLVAGACPPGVEDVAVAMGLFVYAP